MCGTLIGLVKGVLMGCVRSLLVIESIESDVESKNVSMVNKYCKIMENINVGLA